MTIYVTILKAHSSDLWAFGTSFANGREIRPLAALPDQFALWSADIGDFLQLADQGEHGEEVEYIHAMMGAAPKLLVSVSISMNLLRRGI